MQEGLKLLMENKDNLRIGIHVLEESEKLEGVSTSGGIAS